MAEELSDAAKAERLSDKRARLWPVLTIIFLSQQAIYFSQPDDGRPVDHVRVAAWLVLAIVLLLALTTGGGWIHSRSVRRLANDELTQAHRSSAFKAGFLASMAGCIALYFVSLFEPLGGREAIHLVITIGIAAALLRFGRLERDALKGE